MNSCYSSEALPATTNTGKRTFFDAMRFRSENYWEVGEYDIWWIEIPLCLEVFAQVV